MAKRVYLAGAMTGMSVERAIYWRVEARRRLKQAKFSALDPLEFELNQGTELSQVYVQDMALLSQADALIANLDWDEPSIGTIWEIAQAVASGIPVVTYPEYEHVFITEGTKNVRDLEDAVEHLARSMDAQSE